MVEKILNPKHIRKLLNNLPSKFSKYSEFAIKASDNIDDDYVLSVFNIIKNSHKNERIIPYTWEIEYDIEFYKN